MREMIAMYNADMVGRPQTKPAPSFGAQLAALRKARGLTQPQLAQSLGLSVSMLVYYERRACNPTTEFVKKAATVFNVSVDELLDHTSKNSRKSGPPSQLEQRLSAVRQLPRQRQKFLIEILDTFLRDARHPV